MDGTRETTLGIKSEMITKSEEYIRDLGPNDHVFVARITENGEKKVVGFIGLHVNTNPRQGHSARLGIAVHKDYKGRGIGRALSNEILDLADNWSRLLRIKLVVFVDNERAIKLYESLGFQIEGIKKYAAVKEGKYADIYIMARYNL
ncbi:GNAT family N-acetyltransferase [Fervidobacterium gondwanense]|uniref:Putative acetyltransferase n=1 Tax=Fervidobacterium gondwanense DSM 13020 TaxID=1121883 RepID=A0A1M7SKH5_FERGO|nr:GNAT family N-acetyltransferase [Fervidobacterium gondwanense]SHN58967.1 putative acetyltransferase [Fervidobacterium gondwanense DSM 13020]